MSDLNLRKRYDALLFRLKSQQLELHLKIATMLQDPHTDLADIQDVVEDYTQIEGAFLTFKQMVSDHLGTNAQQRAPAPRQAPRPAAAPLPPAAAPAPRTASVPTKAVTTAASPSFKRSQAVRVEREAPAPQEAATKKPATKKAATKKATASKKKTATKKAKTESEE